MQFSDDVEAREACRLIGAYTANLFDLWQLAGPQKASCRAHVMSVLMGHKMPQSKSGITAIRSELYSRLGVQGDCLAVKENEFINACRKEFGQPDANYGGSVLR